jgi:periplasmic protein TonB
METKHVESLEEIIFKDRNKQYGAYSLRKNYHRHIVISLFVAVLFIGSALTYPLMMTRDQKQQQKNDSVFVISEPFSKPIQDPVLPKLPPPPEPVKVEKSLAFIAPRVTNEPIESEYGKQVLLAEKNPSPLASAADPGENPPDKKEPAILQPEKAEPVLWVPEMPHFPGGEKELHAFLLNGIKYPREAREVNIQGTVFLTFIVEPDGSITEISVLRGIGGGCEEEALRVVKSMPNWVPGKQNGNPVRVRLTLPVKFTLHY